MQISKYVVAMPITDSTPKRGMANMKVCCKGTGVQFAPVTFMTANQKADPVLEGRFLVFDDLYKARKWVLQGSLHEMYKKNVVFLRVYISGCRGQQNNMDSSLHEWPGYSEVKYIDVHSGDDIIEMW